MKSKILTAMLMLAAMAGHAQKIAVPPFLKWGNNNAPGCKNVFATRDSLVMAVKNKCTTEGQLTNWRPAVDIDAGQLRYSVPAGASVQLIVTYKFTAAGGDLFAFNGTFDPQSDNSDIAFSRSLVAADGKTSLAETNAYKTVTLKINFSNETDNPKWTSPAMLKGSMTLHFGVTTDNGDETHRGSTAVIKDVKLIIK